MLASYTSPQKTLEVFWFALKKKNILDLGTWFSVGGVRKGYVWLFSAASLWRQHLHKGPKFWLKVWLYSRLEYEALEA